MMFHRKRLKSNMLRAVLDAIELLIGITAPVAKVNPPRPESVFGIVPADGPSGKTMG